jgi:hypothetical protein
MDAPGANGAEVSFEPDPLAELWADPRWRASFDRDVAMRADEWGPEWIDCGVSEEHQPGERAADADGCAAFDAAMTELTDVAERGRMLIARRYRIVAEIVTSAATDPGPWAGPDPTLDPRWRDPRERSVAAVRRDRAEFAVRAAVADAAVRLRMSETTVRTHATRAEILRTRGPELWDAFLAGRLAESAAITAAQLLDSLPSDAPEAWADFDQHAVAVCDRLTPAKFGVFARALRERVHPESIGDRHRRAASDRAVWLSAERDGMATLDLLLPAAPAHAAMSRADATARHLATQDGEERTIAQLRADAMSDLLTRGEIPARMARLHPRSERPWRSRCPCSLSSTARAPSTSHPLPRHPRRWTGTARSTPTPHGSWRLESRAGSVYSPIRSRGSRSE